MIEITTATAITTIKQIWKTNMKEVSDTDKEETLNETHLVADYLHARIAAGIDPLVLGMAAVGVGLDCLKSRLDPKTVSLVLHKCSLDMLKSSDRAHSTLQ